MATRDIAESLLTQLIARIQTLSWRMDSSYSWNGWTTSTELTRLAESVDTNVAVVGLEAKIMPT